MVLKEKIMENTFNYKYSARENTEVQAIRKKYLPQSESKLDELKALDKKVKRPANVFAYVFGSIAAIVMGSGMSLVMTDMGAALGSFAVVLGILAGLVGMVLVALAYPVYNQVLNKERARIAPEILRLTDELMK